MAGRDSGLLLFDAPTDGEIGAYTARAQLTPGETGPHTFTLRQGGRARLLVGGEVVLDGFEDPPPRGEAMIGLVSEEISAEVPLTAGEPVELVVEGTGEGAFATLQGAVVGLRPPATEDLIERAAAAAAACDAAVLIVGTTDEWESEGQDRTDMDLPGDQNALVEAVLDANPDTIVVVNAASPVAMPWSDRAKAVLISWFGGQEMANALADVLTGALDPGGRLPTTQPLRLEHNPSYGNFPGENGEVRYGEGVLIGYRWYDARSLPVRFPFGHGLSYASFEIGAPRLEAGSFTPGSSLGGRGRRHQHERPPRLGGRPALRRAAPERARPPAARAARVREGPPGAGREHDRRARAHRPRVRLLGPGRPELGVPTPARGGLAADPSRRGAPHDRRLADRPGHLRPARRPLVRRPPPRRPAPGRHRLAAPYCSGLSVPGRRVLSRNGTRRALSCHPPEERLHHSRSRAVPAAARSSTAWPGSATGCKRA